MERDISLKIQSLSALRPLFDNLVELAISSQSFEDLRLLAELRRDMLGRIATDSAGAKVLLTGFVAPNTQEIALLDGSTAAMERYLRTDAELGEALHAACSKVSEVLPRWQAWALALEGDWK